MVDDLRALAVFARVAELGSFRAAARALTLSPSVVSHHVSELEARLSVALLYRTTRRLALTPAGAKLLPSARDMVEAAERGLDAVVSPANALRGEVRLTAPAFLADTALPGALLAFSEANPRVSLRVSFSDAPRDLLGEGFDVALRVGRLEDSTHRTRRLADMRRVLVAAPRSVAARRRPRAPKDLADWDYVQLSSRPPELVLARRGRGKSAAVTFTPRVSVDSAAAVRRLTLAGAGLAALPEVLVREDLAAGRLVEVLPDWHLALLGVSAVWPRNAPRAGLTARFVEFMTDPVATVFG